MNKLIDLSGKRFGRLFVFRRGENIRGQPGWECKCDCGKEYTVLGGHLRSGSTRSCGCVSPGMKFVNYVDIEGQRFGRLVALYPSAERCAGRGIKWVCQCDCGKISVVSGESIRDGRTQSCGCLMAERARERARNLGGKNRKYSKEESVVRAIERKEKWRAEHNQSYIESSRRARLRLTESYVRRLLKNSMNVEYLPNADIPSSAITLKRSIIKLKRLIRAQSVTA